MTKLLSVLCVKKNYLGCLPMDPNMTLACEKGISFFDNFPKSLALKPLCTIVDKTVEYCEEKKLT